MKPTDIENTECVMLYGNGRIIFYLHIDGNPEGETARFVPPNKLLDTNRIWFVKMEIDPNSQLLEPTDYIEHFELVEVINMLCTIRESYLRDVQRAYYRHQLYTEDQFFDYFGPWMSF